MILIGNIIAFLGCGLMVLTGFIKNKDKILGAQCVQFVLQATSNLVLGAVSGFISCGLSVVRILVFKRVRVTVWLKLGFIALQGVLTVLAGADTVIEWLPMLAMVVYTWYLDTDSAIVFKFANIFGLALWVVHDLFYQNYVASAFDALTIVSTLSGVFMILRDKKKENSLNELEKPEQ